jgi:hypothetical protein
MLSQRRRLTIAACLLLSLAACQGGGERAAGASAQAWLPTVDTGDYAQSWTAAAPYLQRAVPQAAWDASMTHMRKPLGRVLSRTTRSSKATICALNDPCVVIETDAAFENQPTAVETITVMPVADGQWKVAGYYIK